jgi:hypothetical protein
VGLVVLVLILVRVWSKLDRYNRRWNGNDPANQVAVSSSITGLSIPNGATFWFRWFDFNASGADDGLAVDDFSLTPSGDVVVSDPVINEFVFNHVGTDTHEYVEIFGDPNADYSAFSILQIEGDTTGAGVVDSVHTLGTTNAGGYWFTGFLGNVFENGTVTLLLVEDFSGAVGNDLDTNNDGVFDSTPWSRIVDDVAVSDGGAGDVTYSSTVLAPGFSGGPFTPGGASRIPNGVDTDSAADWTLNDFDGEGLPGFTGTPDPGEAYNTPEAVNELVPDVQVDVVVISQVYGGGGNSGATYTHDFIELKNNSPFPVNLAGFTLELVNGNAGGAVIYGSYDLPDIELSAGGYFVVCANAATVANCDLDVTPDTNLIQNGAPDAVGLRYNGVLMDAVSYEGDTGAPYTEGSGVGLEDRAVGDMSISRCPDGVDTDQNNVDFREVPITPGAENACEQAPAVLSTSPVNGAIDVALGASISVTFTEPVNVTANAFSLECTTSGSVAFTVSGGPTTFTLDPTTDFAYSEVCTVTVFASEVSDQDLIDPPDTMVADYTWSFTTVGDVCLLPFTPIYEIQGSGPVAAITGTVTTQGVVIGDYEGPSPALRGFYIQDPVGDGDPATSDGIFVFNGNNNL